MFSIIRFYISKNIVIKSILKRLVFYFKLAFFYSPLQRKYKKKSERFTKALEGFTGYYDKAVIDPDRQNIVFHRLRGSNCEIYIANLKTNRELQIATTSSWNYQQGAMAEWIDSERVIYNNFNDGSLSAFIFNIKTKSKKEIKHYPVQTLLTGRASYISLNYNRLTKLRPDYGFKNLSNIHEKLTISNDGLWKVDFSGDANLFVSLEELHSIEYLEKSIKSKVNHVSSSKCGTKILFLFRYFQKSLKVSTLFSYDFSTEKLQKLMSGVISHYCWLNSVEYAVWYRTYGGGKLEVYNYLNPYNCIASMQTSDGHPTATEDGSIWFDSYPNLLNYQKIRKFSNDLKTLEDKIVVLNRPVKNIQERCDAHPKCIGSYLVLDSHQTQKREITIYESSKSI